MIKNFVNFFYSVVLDVDSSGCEVAALLNMSLLKRLNILSTYSFVAQCSGKVGKLKFASCLVLIFKFSCAFTFR